MTECLHCGRAHCICKSLWPADRPDLVAAQRPPRYTCIGKGGVYELLGTAQGAGYSRGEKAVVYRDVDTGALYFRTEIDFNTRMEKV